ncbi:dihydroxy-acid dehydratase [Propionibacteriaceae bacterium Y1685]
MTDRLRSQRWYGDDEGARSSFIHRAWMRRGNPAEAPEKPQIAIASTASALAPCNAHLTDIARSVSNGVWEAGGVPLEMPVMSLGETNMRPTAMLFRNLAAMSIEEQIRANPIDGVVLLGGCDKTIPALLMAAASAGLPAIALSGGPMLTGTLAGRRLGCGTDVWRLSEEVRAGTLAPEVFAESEQAMIRSAGHCNTMGTASTMACVTEALGMSLPGTAGLPAPDARLAQAGHLTGRRIVEMVAEDLTPDKIITRAALTNAVIASAAIGGSTNAVVHLLAIAGRLGIDFDLADIDAIGHGIDLLVNLQPSGEHLMEDFHRAGGLRAVLAQISDRLDPTAVTVTGRSLVDEVAGAVVGDPTVISPPTAPLMNNAGLAVLHGNLAPDGAVIKPAAATEALLTHRGPALVFDSIEEFGDRIDDPELDVTPDTVLVVRGCGPRGYPGMPEVGNLPLPAKLLAAGVRDMVRISDARMSGTAYGTVVLHVAPESAADGPLARLRTGDLIVLDVPNRRLDVEVDQAEFDAREHSPEARRSYAAPTRGWTKLYVDTVQQADRGADLDFLVGSTEDTPARESH